MAGGQRVEEEEQGERVDRSVVGERDPAAQVGPPRQLAPGEAEARRVETQVGAVHDRHLERRAFAGGGEADALGPRRDREQLAVGPPGRRRRDGSIPMVKAASTQDWSPWSSDARAWLAPRPTRSTSTITVAGPGSGAHRKWAVTASGSRCGLSATVERVADGTGDGRQEVAAVGLRAPPSTPRRCRGRSSRRRRGVARAWRRRTRTTAGWGLRETWPQRTGDLDPRVKTLRYGRRPARHRLPRRLRRVHRSCPAREGTAHPAARRGRPPDGRLHRGPGPPVRPRPGVGALPRGLGRPRPAAATSRRTSTPRCAKPAPGSPDVAPLLRPHHGRPDHRHATATRR